MTTAAIDKSIETSNVRVGIIGTGGRGIGCFGKLLKEHDGVHLAALADPNMQRLEGAQQTLESDAALYTDVEAMLRESKLDGVVVTTPDFTHADTVIAALYAGVKHILVDKPLATTTDGCVKVVKAMEETGGKVAIGFNLRHAPLLARIKEIIANGEIGELMLAENREFYDLGRTYMARWNRKYAWSGGLWIHKGSHDFDIFNWWNEGGVPQT
ncbi:MAG: Gfo/Idh/MocA family oxidoreductase, partial [Abditibacteriaceae bacterium]